MFHMFFTLEVFLVSAFLVKRARLLQWLVFFRQTTDLIVYVPLFTDFTRSRLLVRTVFSRFTVNTAVTGSSPCCSHKLFRPIVFRSVRLLLNFFVSKGSPLPLFNVFDILHQTGCSKSPTGTSPFYRFKNFALT